MCEIVRIAKQAIQNEGVNVTIQLIRQLNQATQRKPINHSTPLMD